MADQTEITNVGGEGVASEITLANLLAVTEQMAKKAGIDPKDVNKKLKALSTATTDTIKVSTKNRDGLKKNTKAVDESTGAFKKLSGMLSGAVLSSFAAVARSGTEMTRAFINGETSMTAFASQIPLIGNQLSILTGLFDDSFSAFQSVATSGAAFNNSLTDLRISAAEAHLSLDAFTSFIGANSDKLAAFGGTATMGAKAISNMTKELGTSGMQGELLNMGFTFEEINEAMLDYMYLTRAGNRVRMQSDAALKLNTANAAEYAKHQQTLAKLAGAEAKTAQEAIATQMQDVAFQSRLATMSAEEQAKVNNAMQLAMMTGGQDAVDALKAEFLGMPAVTEGARMFTATMSTQLGMLTSTLQDAQNENITQTQFNNQLLNTQVDLMAANAASAAEYDTLIRAAGAGVEGSAATIAGFFNNASLKYTDYFDQSTGQFSRAIAAEDAARAAAEADNRDTTTNTVATFMATIAELRAAFETSIITPLMQAVAPALNALVTAIRGPIDEAGNPIGESGFATALATVGDYINNQLAPAILQFVEAFKDDPMATIKEYFNTAISGLGNLIKDFFLGPMMQGPLMPGQERERGGGALQDAIVPMISAAGDAIAEGISAWWSESSLFTKTMVIGAGALFLAGGPLATAMAAGASTLFNSIRGGAGASRAGAGAGAAAGAGAGFTKAALRRLGPLAVLIGALDMGSTLLNDDLSRDEKQQSVVETGGGMAGAAGGAYAGAAAGAAIGSVVPLLGTAIGGALGGLLGGGLGWWAGSSAAGAANQSLTSDGTAEGSTNPSGPTMDSPGAQLAMILSTEQVSNMERIAAVDLSTFNSGFQALLRINTRNASRFAELDFTTFATGLSMFARIPDLQTNFNIINSLDAAPVKTYTEAMEDLVEVLAKVNEELSRDNNGFSFGTGTNAGDLLGQIGSATSGTSQGTEQLNSTMQQVLSILQEMRDLDIDVEKNTRNIIGSNLALGGVSNVSR